MAGTPGIETVTRKAWRLTEEAEYAEFLQASRSRS